MANYFNFIGRIGRISYLLRSLAQYLVVVVAFAGVMLAARSEAFALFGMVAFWSVMLVSLWFSLCQASKRAHDLGHSGWLALGMLVPGFNVGVFVYLLAWPGESAPNAHGPMPGAGAPVSV